MTTHRKWTCKESNVLVNEYLALYDAWEKATAEADWLREQNKLQKKQLLDIDSRISPLMAENANLRAELAERREVDWVLAADAERLIQDAQTTPVDLLDEETLAERLHEAYEAVWPEDGRLKWNKLRIDGLQRKGRMAQARAVLDLLSPWLAERAPVADAETLEDLVKIVYDAVWQCAMAKPKWEYIEEERKIQWRNTVAAILRAARPTVRDIDYAQIEALIAEGGGANYAPLWDYVDSRIRYRVELPADECDIATAAYMLGKHDGKTADCPTCARVRAALEGEG